MLCLYAALVEDEQTQVDFDHLYRIYRKQMLYVAARILGDPHEAEDAVQNAFIRLVANGRKIPFGDERELRLYVLTVVKNAALNLLERRRLLPLPTDPAELPPDPEPDVSDRIEASLDCKKLMEILRKLPQPYREVLQCVYLYECSPREAARILERNPDTLRKQLHRGRELLRKLCEKENLNYGSKQ